MNINLNALIKNFDLKTKIMTKSFPLILLILSLLGSSSSNFLLIIITFYPIKK